MKSLGIIRKVDELGRIVIPIELRSKFGLVENTQIEIFYIKDKIILKKYHQDCVSCGIIRKLDELGRVVIPVELREKFKIFEKDPIEIFVEKDTIILKKYQPDCIFCRATKKLKTYRGKLVCEKCIQRLGKV